MPAFSAREAFGKKLAKLGANFDIIAECRMEIEMAGLLCLKAAWMIDQGGPARRRALDQPDQGGRATRRAASAGAATTANSAAASVTAIRLLMDLLPAPRGR